MIEAGLLSVVLSFAPRPLRTRDDERLHLLVTSNTETPLPVGVVPTALLDGGTGSTTLAQGPADLVRTARAYVQAIAVLPIDPDDDALIERAVAERMGGTLKKRALPRR